MRFPTSIFRRLLICAMIPLGVTAQHRIPKAVFIIADGIPADVIEKLAPPTISALGTYKRTYTGGNKGSYSETPTISAPGYNNLITGTWGYKHNVWGNDIKSPNYQYWNIFRYLKESYPQKTTAIFSSWLDNRTKLAGDGLPEAGKLKIDHHYDGFELDTIRFPHDNKSWYIHLIDEQVVHKADSVIRSAAPDLSWVYLEYTDDMGHKYGDSEPFYQAVHYLDVQMDKLHKAIQYREKHFAEDWLIILTTDHGRDAATGKNHGGQSDRERTTWIATNAKKLNNYFRNYQPAVVDILPTIATHLQIKLPESQKRELDGISLAGPVSVVEPRLVSTANSLLVNWKSLGAKERVKIWLATTNHFKTGGADNYVLVGEMAAARNRFSIPIKNQPSNFYKVVIEGKYNSINVWSVSKTLDNQ